MMKKIIAFALLFAALLCDAFALDADGLLADVDSHRAVGPSFRFKIRIDDYAKGSLSQSAVMAGNAKGVNKTMVQYEEPANMRGKKLLMVDDEMYIFVPKTQRPVRLTASQRLMGQASNGDVMNVRFQADYSPAITGEESVATKEGERLCVVLELKAKRAGSAYNRMVLWVDKESHCPVKADCFALSGKLLKTVEYSQVRSFGDKKIVTRATLYDKIARDTYTVIEFIDMSEAEIPDSFFNKEYLLRM
jgi:hypothetical protein